MMTNKMNHPLTDEILEKVFDYVPWLEKHSELMFSKEDMRTAYDLGYTAGSQAAEGAMKAIIDTIRENSKSMEILAMGDKEEMEDALDTLLALEREKDGHEPITIEELDEL